MRNLSFSRIEGIMESNYLFHAHTSFEYNGEIPVQKYFRAAVDEKICHLFFVLSVTKQDGRGFFSSLEFTRYVDEVRECSSIYGVYGYAGIETMVLPGGLLDIPGALSDQVDFVAINDHFFSSWSSPVFKASMINAFSHPSYRGLVKIWVGPFQGDDPDLYTDLAIVAKNNNVLVEWNSLAKKGIVGGDIRTRVQLDRALGEKMCQMI